MMCYRDMTFCSSDCVNEKCHRFFGDRQREGAKLWWEGCEGEPPVAFSDFSSTCVDYRTS